MRGVMPDKGESSSPLRFAAVVLPWLLAGVMSAVYLLTLNHWVAPESLELVAKAVPASLPVLWSHTQRPRYLEAQRRPPGTSFLWCSVPGDYASAGIGGLQRLSPSRRMLAPRPVGRTFPQKLLNGSN